MTFGDRPRPSFPRRAGRFLGAVAAFALATAAAGFIWFASRIPTEEIAIERNADAIVVLTGGASRISDAIELLAAGRGKRLLISGVHPATKFTEIARLTPAYQRLFGCCVDLDHSALNTIGNAVQTRRWVEARGFRSLIVVTSNYHLPRSMAELAAQMPDVALQPFPVVSDQLRGEFWWTREGALRLIVSEYVKYVLAQIRIHIDPSGQAAGLMTGMRDAGEDSGRGPATGDLAHVPLSRK